MILHFTDLHFRKPLFAAVTEVATRLRADVCISGDLLFDGANAPELDEQARWVAEWIRAQAFRLFICTGNHDDVPVSETFGGWLRELSDGKRVFTDYRKARSMCGMVIGCLPYGSSFESEREGIFLSGIDVLVTHEPPFGCDAARDPRRHDWGSADLSQHLADGEVRAVLCGHVHEPRAYTSRFGATVISNPGVDREQKALPYHVIRHVRGRVTVRRATAALAAMSERMAK